eukprot:6307024-Pyramimonas_sp.AAC.1
MPIKATETKNFDRSAKPVPTLISIGALSGFKRLPCNSLGSPMVSRRSPKTAARSITLPSLG